MQLIWDMVSYFQVIFLVVKISIRPMLTFESDSLVVGSAFVTVVSVLFICDMCFLSGMTIFWAHWDPKFCQNPVDGNCYDHGAGWGAVFRCLYSVGLYLVVLSTLATFPIVGVLIPWLRWILNELLMRKKQFEFSQRKAEKVHETRNFEKWYKDPTIKNDHEITVGCLLKDLEGEEKCFLKSPGLNV